MPPWKSFASAGAMVSLCLWATPVAAQTVEELRTAYEAKSQTAFQSYLDSWSEASRNVPTDERRTTIELVDLTYEIVEAFSREYIPRSETDGMNSHKYLVIPTTITGGWNGVEFKINNFYPKVEIEGKTTLYGNKFELTLNRFILTDPLREFEWPKNDPDLASPFGNVKEPQDYPEIKAEITARANFVREHLPLRGNMYGKISGLSYAYNIHLFIETPEKAFVLLNQDCTDTFISAEKVDDQWQFTWRN